MVMDDQLKFHGNHTLIITVGADLCVRPNKLEKPDRQARNFFIKVLILYFSLGTQDLTTNN